MITSFPIGWLSPQGEMYECGYMDHIYTARTLVNKYGYNDENSNSDEILINHHWAHLTVTTFFSHSWMILWKNPYENHLTQEQKYFLKPYIEEFKDWINSSCLRDLEDEFEEILKKEE